MSEKRPGSSDSEVPDEPVPGLAALRDVAPPPSLVARVMTQVAAPPPFSWWRWLRRPRRLEVRLSVLSGATMTMALLGTLGLVVRSTGARDAMHADASRSVEAPRCEPGSGQDAPVLVRFAFEARGAHEVAIAGSFNDWRAQPLRSEDGAPDGVFAATLALARGTHEYMFVVDGRWVADPLTAARRPDGFGRQNSLLRL